MMPFRGNVEISVAAAADDNDHPKDYEFCAGVELVGGNKIEPLLLF